MKHNRPGRHLLAADFPLLEAHFVEHIRDLRSRDALAPIVVLVGTNLLRLHLQRTLARSGVNHLNVRFVNFGDLVREALDVIDAGLKPAPQFASELLVKQACEELNGGDFYFKDLIDKPGLHRALAATIQDLKQGGFTLAQFSQAASRIDWGSTAQTKVRSFTAVWKRHESLKSGAGLIDEEDAMARAVARVGALPLWREALAFLVYGIYDFNQLQQQLLLACAESRDTVVFFPHEESPAFNFATATLTQLVKNGFTVTRPERKTDGWIDNLFRDVAIAPRPSILNPQSAIQVLSVPGESREAREVLREVIRLASAQAQPFHRVGILLRNPAQYARLLREACQSLGLAPYAHEGVPLSETPAGRSLLLLLRIVDTDYSRRAVMEFVTSTIIAYGDQNPPTALWDALTMKAGIVEGGDEWAPRLERLQKKLARDRERRREDRPVPDAESVKSLLAFIRGLFKMLKQLSTARDWSNLVDRFVATVARFVAESDERQNALDCVNKLRDLQALSLTPDVALFSRLCEEALESQSARSGLFERDGPTIVGMMQARGVSFDTVIVPGLVEKSFPAPPKQDPILLDHERSELEQAARSRGFDVRLPTKGARLDEEKLLFRLAVGAARQRLVLTYPRLEMEGARERIPSHYLLAVKEAVTGQRADFKTFEQWPLVHRVRLSDAAPAAATQAIDAVEFDLSSAQHALKSHAPQRLLAFKDSPHFARALRAEHMRWSQPFFTAWDGMIRDGDAALLLKPRLRFDEPLSASRLERYAKCPFLFFLKDVLALDPLEEPETQVDPDHLEKGLLLHDLLATFFKQEKEAGRLPVRADTPARLLEFANAKLDEWEQDGATGLRVIWQLEREEIVEQLRVFIENELQDREFVPAEFELWFGGRDEIPPPTLEVAADRTLQFRGRIDRVDVAPAGASTGERARITDYKSGRTPKVDQAYFGHGEALQAGIYALAVAARGQRPVHARYLSLKIGERSRHLDIKSWPDTLNDLRHTVRTLVASAERGVFLQYPKGDRCELCDFKSVCMSTQHPLHEMKRGDLQAAEFLALKDAKKKGR